MHMTELLKKAKIIGNPGCYPTSIGLALAPALVKKIILIPPTSIFLFSTTAEAPLPLISL